MASVSGNNKIVLKASWSEGGTECEEGILGSAAYPGTNVVLTPAVNYMERHTYTPGSTDYVGTGTDTTTTKAPVRVLVEDALQGNTVTTQYSASNNCFVHNAKSGDHLQVLVASGQSVIKAQGLSAGTDGIWVTDATNAAVIALETSGTLSENTLVRVQVL